TARTLAGSAATSRETPRSCAATEPATTAASIALAAASPRTTSKSGPRRRRRRALASQNGNASRRRAVTDTRGQLALPPHQQKFVPLSLSRADARRPPTPPPARGRPARDDPRGRRGAGLHPVCRLAAAERARARRRLRGPRAARPQRPPDRRRARARRAR